MSTILCFCASAVTMPKNGGPTIDVKSHFCDPTLRFNAPVPCRFQEYNLSDGSISTIEDDHYYFHIR